MRGVRNPERAPWTAHEEPLRGGLVRRIALRHDGGALCYAKVVQLWRQCRSFRAFWTSLLADAPYAAYFWETPPVTRGTAGRPFEFVLIDSPQLAALAPEPETFAHHFKPAQATATFVNLGGDAVLVAPAPQGAPASYAHLAAFARQAPVAQQEALWQAVGAAVVRRLSSQPLWLSTSGLGVAWLHLRLDERPKYYTYAPYRGHVG